MQSKFKLLILLTSALGATAVILGAFGSHYLAERLSEKALSAYKTGVQYQFYHTLALFGSLYFIIGTLLFSGSLYLLALKDLIGISIPKVVGLITPLGGLALVGAWAAIFFTVIKIKTK